MQPCIDFDERSGDFLHEALHKRYFLNNFTEPFCIILKKRTVIFMRYPCGRRRIAALLLVLALLWVALGAPLTEQEWAAAPQRLRLALLRVPSQTVRVFRLWYTAADGAQAEADASLLRVYDAEVNAVRLLPLEDYLIGVVAAEMPASWPPAALACQAVAARTRALAGSARYGGQGCARHPEADVCTDSACCQGWLGPEARKARWGDGAAPCERRVRQAVQATAGQLLTYHGQPIETLYHAASGGRTEAARAVFSADVPYLQSVASPGEESYDGFTAVQRFSLEDAAAQLLCAFPESSVTAADLPAQLELLSLTETGRVQEMRVGNVTATGREVRAALGLRSTLFTWECAGDTLTFSVRGYGHGVGMSQAGARAMAEQGAGYEEILSHYYPGTVLTTAP